jgi:hypothetical protein
MKNKEIAEFRSRLLSEIADNEVPDKVLNTLAISTYLSYGKLLENNLDLFNKRRAVYSDMSYAAIDFALAYANVGLRVNNIILGKASNVLGGVHIHHDAGVSLVVENTVPVMGKFSHVNDYIDYSPSAFYRNYTTTGDPEVPPLSKTSTKFWKEVLYTNNKTKVNSSDIFKSAYIRSVPK